MFRGYYLASNGILNQQRMINTISDNVANAQTAGYKSDLSIQNTFHEKLILLNQGRINKTGTIEYRYTENTLTDLTQGSLEFSSRPLDIALKGPVYFHVENIVTPPADENTPIDPEAPYDVNNPPSDKPLLTRNGQFVLDDEGYISTEQGARLLDNNGKPILVETSDFTVDNAGQIFIDGNLSGQIGLSYIPDGCDVQKYDDNVFSIIPDKDGNFPDTNIPADLDYDVVQGAFERSNVDVALEMTRVMEAQRTFESLSKVIQMYSSINSQTSQLSKL